MVCGFYSNLFHRPIGVFAIADSSIATFTFKVEMTKKHILTCDNKPDSDTEPDRIIFIITINSLSQNFLIKF